MKAVLFYLTASALIYGSWYLSEQGVGANQDYYKDKQHRSRTVRVGSGVGGYYGGGSVK